MTRRPRRRTLSSHLVAHYDYRDEQGTLRYQVLRYDPKDFSVRTVAGKSLWEGGRYPRIPYRLPELLASDPTQTVYVVEGEKDVDRLWSLGLPATCNAFGGGKHKWTRGHARYLRGRPVVILPDNDATGREHGLAVARSLRRIAKSIKLIKLPGLSRKGDVSDWLDAGHTLQELLALVKAAPLWRRSLEDWLPEPDWNLLYGSDYDALRTAQDQRRRIYGMRLPPGEKLLLMLLSEYRAPPVEELAWYLRVTPRRAR
ncbi:MAG TPA: hypothetical protein VK797_18045, partial [Tepidisphaeraceae bacterium]|nr:hypothetical protein [Tepidisphaeraceae bacterium]